MGKFNENVVREGVRRIIDGLGLNPSDPNLVDTPDRVTRAYREVFRGLVEDLDEQTAAIFSASFPSEYRGMVIICGIKVFSMCPHHLLPVEYSVDVGYLPKSKMIGLSKLPRLVELLAARPVLQETFTHDITSNLMKHLEAEGAMAVARGDHLCMRMRGVAQHTATTITSSVEGSFKTNPATKQEFLELAEKAVSMGPQ